MTYEGLNRSALATLIFVTLYKTGKKSLRELAQKFGVSKRTILRAIDDLSTVIPIVSSFGRNGGYSILGEFELTRFCA